MVSTERNFGDYLRIAREKKGISLEDLSRATKIKESQLERLEQAKLEALPAEVFVVGFIKAYAREVGVDSVEALKRYRAAQPKPLTIEIATAPSPEDPYVPQSPLQKRFGVALVVFLILIVATITLSLLLRHTPPGGGLS
jgi:cytoskeletal protein RodZ